MKNFLWLIVCVALSGGVAFSCQGELAGFEPEISDKLTKLKIKLTDLPANVEEVNIDLKSVVVISANEAPIPLETEQGIYNLLDYQNGLSTVIAEGLLAVDGIRQIRLILGDNNSVKVNGSVRPLKVPSGQQTGLKIRVCLDLRPHSEYELLLDFDAGRSVVRLGNTGMYLLKPVINVKNEDARCDDEDDNDYEEDDDDDDDDD